MKDTDVYAIPGFAEPVGSLTHLIGAAVFALLSIPLLRRSPGGAWPRFCLVVFALACVFQLAMSGIYHMLPHEGQGRPVLLRLDHAAIFILIAATYTPIHGILLDGWRRWLPLIIVWTIAIASVCLKTIYFDAFPRWLGLTLYLSLGWLGLVTGAMLWHRYGRRFLRLLVWGGVAFTVGAVFDFANAPVVAYGIIGPHELFHVAVLVGIAFFWSFTWTIAAGREAVEELALQYRDQRA